MRRRKRQERTFDPRYPLSHVRILPATERGSFFAKKPGEK